MEGGLPWGERGRMEGGGKVEGWREDVEEGEEGICKYCARGGIVQEGALCKRGHCAGRDTKNSHLAFCMISRTFLFPCNKLKKNELTFYLLPASAIKPYSSRARRKAERGEYDWRVARMDTHALNHAIRLCIVCL